MTCIVTSDLHFTDRPADAYRWPILEWLGERAKEQSAEEVLILGDITDAKDRHSAKLVNRLFDELANLSAQVRVFILKGNHDYIDPTNPFFKFVDNLDNVEFITERVACELSIGKASFIPAGVPWDFKLLQVTPYAFTHVTFDGSESESGRLLPGIDPASLSYYEGKVYSGDIHVPQKIRKNIEYVGAPYHCHFGDVYEPRVLVIRNDGRTFDLHFPAPKKHTISIQDVSELAKLKFSTGDQVKVRVHLRRADHDKWREIQAKVRRICEDKGWVLAATELRPIAPTESQSEILKSGTTSAEDLVDAYAKKMKASDDHLALGKELLKQ